MASVAERPDLRTFGDDQVWTLAQVEGRAVVTRDRVDYLEIERRHRASKGAHSGLILIPSGIPEPGVGPLVKALDVLVSGGPLYRGFVHWL